MTVAAAIGGWRGERLPRDLRAARAAGVRATGLAVRAGVDGALRADRRIAGWLVWRRVGLDRSMAPYAVQLVLNACWTPLFFAAGWYAAALVEIVVLLVAIGVTIAMFARRSRLAAVLLVPYAAWVAFATCLNAGIWWLNR